MKSSRIKMTYEGNDILSMFASPTKDRGLSIGFTDPSFGNIHLTTFLSPKDNRIHSHITDKFRKSKPYSQQIDSSLYKAVINKITKNWYTSIDSLGKCYMPKGSLHDKLSKLLPQRLRDGSLSYPIEMNYTLIKTDFNNTRRWEELDSSEIFKKSGSLIFTIYHKRLCIVSLLEENTKKVLCYTDKQYQRFINKTMRLMGVDIFLAYLELAVTDKVKR